MVEDGIGKLEARMETLIEGFFTRLMPHAPLGRDIAIIVLRAMEDAAVVSTEYGDMPIAPDEYAIILDPDSAAKLQRNWPDLCQATDRSRCGTGCRSRLSPDDRTLRQDCRFS